jgi:hypothetical protein
MNKGNEEDHFSLCWFDEKPATQKQFQLDLTQRITPPDILTQLRDNGINLTQKWLILDEFIYFKNGY